MILRHIEYRTATLLMSLLSVVLSVVLLTGCSDAAEQQAPEEVSGLVNLSFKVAALENAPLNPDGHDEEAGEGGEIKIYDNEWLNVYVHDAVTGELKFHFNGKGSSPLTSMLITKDEEGAYNVKISTRALILGKDYRISVMVNCLDNNGDLYRAAIQFQNTPDNTTFLQNPHWMSFSGFRRFTLPADIENKATLDIGTIWLLRSQARIDVELTDEMRSKWTILNARLAGLADKLYSTSYASVAEENVMGVYGTEELTMDQMFRPRRSQLMSLINPKEPDLLMRDVPDENGTGHTFRIYLPEQDNPMLDGEEIKISLRMKHIQSGTEYDTWLYLRNYPGNEPLNIVRNHIYRYTITSVKPLFETSLTILAPSHCEINVPAFN